MHVLVIAGSYNVCVYIGNVYNIILSVTNIFTPEKLLKKPELHIPFAYLTAGLVLNKINLVVLQLYQVNCYR